MQNLQIAVPRGPPPSPSARPGPPPQTILGLPAAPPQPSFASRQLPPPPPPSAPTTTNGPQAFSPGTPRLPSGPPVTPPVPQGMPPFSASRPAGPPMGVPYEAPPTSLQLRGGPPPSSQPFGGFPASSQPYGVPPTGPRLYGLTPSQQFAGPPQPFTATPAVSPPFGPPMWQTQPAGAPLTSGTMQTPPGMLGMSPQLTNQQLPPVPPVMNHMPLAGAQVSTPSKIDPNQIPRPMPSSSVVFFETRLSNQVTIPPPATSEFIVRDTGNCSPRLMRCTMNQIPCTGDLLSTSSMPLALMIQPLALPHPEEEPIRAAICQTCGSTGFEEFLIVCSVCGISAEHSYCGHKKSENWKCDLCEPRDPKILSPCQPKFSRFKKRSVKRKVKGSNCILGKDLLEKPLIDNTTTVAVKQADRCHVSSEPTCEFRTVDTSEKGSILKIVDASNVVGGLSNITEDTNFRKPRRRLVLAEEDDIDEDSQDSAIPPTDENYVEKVKSVQSSENNESANVPLTDSHDFDELDRSGNLSSGSDGGKQPTKHRRRLILLDDDQLEHEQINQSVQDRKMEVFGALESKETYKNQSRSYHLGENETYVPAMPIINHAWRGNFNISNDNYGPLSAHLSNIASPRVRDCVALFPGVLQAEKHSRLDVWPNSFKVSPPNDHNIGLYFFPRSERADQMLKQLLEEFIKTDVALKVTFDNAELLIFTSIILPVGFQRFRGKFYLWGVFRGRKDMVMSRPIDDDPKSEVCEEGNLGDQNDDDDRNTFLFEIVSITTREHSHHCKSKDWQ